MQLFTEYVSWQNYAATQFAGAEVQEERAEANVKRLEAQGMVLGDPKATVALTKAIGYTSKEMEQAESDRLVAYAHRKMTQVVLQNCERCASLVSRELSRRIGGLNSIERRNARWNA